MKNYVKTEDIYEIKIMDDPIISEDGTKLLYTVASVQKEEPFYKKHIVMKDMVTGEAEDIICGTTSYRPTWKNGKQEIAFLSNKTGTSQIWLYEVETKKYTQITHMRNGVQSFALSNSENCYIYLASINEGNEELDVTNEYTEEEQKENSVKKERTAKHITDIIYRFDGQGYLEREFGQVWTCAINGENIQRITNNRYDYVSFSCSPKSEKIVAVSTALEDPLWKPQDNVLWDIDIDSKECKILTEDLKEVAYPIWDTTEENIYLVAHEGQYGWSTSAKLYCYNTKKATTTCMTKEIDLEMAFTGINDIRPSTTNRGLIYDESRKSIYLIVSDDGDSHVLQYNIEKNTLDKVVGGEREVYSFSMTKDLSKVVFGYSTTTLPNAIGVYDREKKVESLVENINEAYVKETEISVPEKVSFASFDGLEIHGWIMKPSNFEEGKIYPAIVEIHGGPSMMYSNTYMNEFQMLAAAGYVVCYCNPRGSSGSGQAFQALNYRQNGGRGPNDSKDVIALANYVGKLAFVDENNIGVTGGSYGGYLTNWLVGHTDMFKAALAQRSIANWIQYRGDADYGFIDPKLSHDVDYFEEDYLKYVSPITYAKNINTPLCIVHSENDYRCPLSQAQELYTTLKVMGKYVEMYLFPNSSHSLSRSGCPPLRVQRLEIIRDWFNKFLV